MEVQYYPPEGNYQSIVNLPEITACTYYIIWSVSSLAETESCAKLQCILCAM
jgi:hypothetical protein